MMIMSSMKIIFIGNPRIPIHIIIGEGGFIPNNLNDITRLYSLYVRKRKTVSEIPVLFIVLVLWTMFLLMVISP